MGGWVGYLGKELLEVIAHVAGLLGENGKRRVVTH